MDKTGATKGRPTLYSDEIAHEICERLANGESLLQIVNDKPDHYPERSTIYSWLSTRPDFLDMYTQARVAQTECILDDALHSAMDDSNDTLTLYDKLGKPYTAANQAALQRAKLKVDACLKIVEKLAPRKYGSKLELAGDKDSPLTVNIVKFGDSE